MRSNSKQLTEITILCILRKESVMRVDGESDGVGENKMASAAATAVQMDVYFEPYYISTPDLSDRKN